MEGCGKDFVDETIFSEITPRMIMNQLQRKLTTLKIDITLETC